MVWVAPEIATIVALRRSFALHSEHVVLFNVLFAVCLLTVFVVHWSGMAFYDGLENASAI